MPKPLSERGRLLETTARGSGGAVRRRIQIITPGWGSSGYYSADVLERAAEAKIIAAGTHMYLNHASESERTDRPERDVRDIAAVLAEDATWDGTSLSADADLIGPHAELVEALAPYIGVSISGSATDITIGEAEGRTGPIVEDLAHVSSVDFVTHAGRGGQVLLESARPSIVNALAVGHGIEEATADERRRQLSDVVRSAYAGEDRYAWVQDFDDTTVWFEASAENERSRTWEQSYTVAADDMSVALSGERVEVRQVTRYVPIGATPPPIVSATRSDSTTNTTQESQEDPMQQIEEARLRELEEAHGRVPALESERDTAIRERDEARSERDGLRRDTQARSIIAESDAEFDDLQVVGLLANLPLNEAGELDADAFTTRVTEAATKIRERLAGTSGQIVGFGGNTVSESGSYEDFENDFFGTEKGA